MNEVIYLEPDEEITGVIDRLKKTEAQSVVLVIPRGAAILQSVVNLKLLKKEAEILGQEISLVTMDKVGRNLASQVGLTVYDDLKEPKPVVAASPPPPKPEDTIELDLSPGKPTEPPKGLKVHHFQEERRKSWLPRQIDLPPKEMPAQAIPSSQVGPPISRKKYMIVLGVILVVVIAVMILTLPRVTLVLSVKGEPFEKTADVTVSSRIGQSDLKESLVPGNLLEIAKEDKRKFPATGKKDVGEKAQTTMTVSNGTGVDQTLTSGTVFTSSGGLEFVSIKEVTVPKATLNAVGDKVSGTATVGVIAKEPGEKYNLPAGDYTVADKDRISGKAPATAGGSTRQVSVVSLEDQSQGRDTLTSSLASQATGEIKEKAKGNVLLDEAIKTSVLSSNASAAPGTETNEFEMTVKAKTQVMVFGEKPFREVVLSKLKKDIPQDKELYLTNRDEIAIKVVEFGYDEGSITFQGQIKTKLVPKIDQNLLKQQVKGKGIVQAQEILQTVPDVQGTEIRFRPIFWPIKIIPRLLYKIKFEFRY